VWIRQETNLLFLHTCLFSLDHHHRKSRELQMASRLGASMKRQQADISKLMMSRYEIDVNEDAAAKGHTEFMLNNFNGPPGSM
jgi:hypothetical protein